MMKYLVVLGLTLGTSFGALAQKVVNISYDCNRKGTALNQVKKIDLVYVDREPQTYFASEVKDSRLDLTIRGKQVFLGLEFGGSIVLGEFKAPRTCPVSRSEGFAPLETSNEITFNASRERVSDCREVTTDGLWGYQVLDTTKIYDNDTQVGMLSAIHMVTFNNSQCRN